MLRKIADTVKGLSVDAVERAGSGHPGMPVGCAELTSLLFGEVMSYYPEKPQWPDRDRFVLSAGHGSMLLYSFLHLSGFDLSLEDLKNFRQLESPTPGHPEFRDTPGVETTTGPLGQGFSNAVGMALAERMLASRYNTEKIDLIDHHTYVLASDGDLMEGISSEAGSLAGHLGLGKLIVFYDSNKISIEGSTDLAFTENAPARFEAFNWQVIEDVDGYDYEELRDAVSQARSEEKKPTLIEVKTEIAHQAPTMEGDAGAHGAPLGEEEIRGLKEKIGLPPEEKFFIPEEVNDFWREKRAELREEYSTWQDKFERWQEENPELYKQWQRAHDLEIPEGLSERIDSLDMDMDTATRKSAGKVLSEIMEEVDYLVGGSADLAPSNKTYQEDKGEVQAGEYSGRNFRFGVREHAMGGIVNGISLHSGLRPFAATFLVFSDYMRPAIRLAALMKLPNIYVFTHDSIFIGEDGPTHQPVEHLESLRVMPNLQVLRPADAEEAAAAWQQALEYREGPTALILTRQSCPSLDRDNEVDMESGGYVIRQSENPDTILMASGSEVSLAVEVAELLENEGISARVISIPNREKFSRWLSAGGGDLLRPNSARRVVLEAGVSQGWYEFIGAGDLVFSVEDFGQSAPGEEVGRYFGFDAEEIARDIKSNLT